MILSNAVKHFKKICIHKYYVAKYCFMCGLYWQGIVHDLSKFSPTEFCESVKYYCGTGSPINACKADKGYSLAWFHHRGRNLHHWAHWVDDFDQGMIPKKMPFKYVLEMMCDYLGAGQAYSKEKFTIWQEYDWWKIHRKIDVMHKDVIKAMDIMFAAMLKHGIESTLHNRKFLKKLQEKYENSFN